MSTPRVFLCPGDATGWAIDEDRRLTAEALGGIATLVDTPRDADVIHANWWTRVVELPRDALAGKPVVCHMVGEVARVMAEPMFVRALDRVTHWLAPSRAAVDDLAHVVPRVSHAPYAIGPEWFDDAPTDDAVAAARGTLPDDALVVLSVHRDTAGAGIADAPIPKDEKGPDALVEVLAGLRDRGLPAAALLGGPRRHWIRRELTRRGVPWAFVGDVRVGDDYPANTLAPERVRAMLGASDLALITSRSEGGPRTLLEACAAGTPVFSTGTGHAADILTPSHVVRDPLDMVDRVIAHRDAGALPSTTEAHRAIVRTQHSVAVLRAALAGLYRDLKTTARRAQRITVRVPTAPGRRVALWNNFQPPPWGGGNQFMIALETELRRQGVETVRNGEADAHIVNSVQFPRDDFERVADPRTQRVVHRIDGPISVLRGTPESHAQDREAMRFNAGVASATVIQSRHTLRFLAELGWRPVCPVLIRNAVDPEVFFPGPPRERVESEPVRVIATCWSPSPGKGAAVYEWLAEHLDPARHRLTFVGNLPPGVGALNGVDVRPPVASAALADVLREHDVYLTASRNDPCSNALIEALACGLPAIYYDGGGHPELAGFGGLGFTRPEQVPMLIDRIMARRDAYRRMIRTESMAAVARRYLALCFDDGVYTP